MDKFFKLKDKGTNIRTEAIAGFTTFFAMAYVIFVNPEILSVTGMNKSGVFAATVLATVIGTALIGLLANIPYALAPGMGLNAFFAYTICIGMGFVWQEALAMVFISGIIGIIITATRLRSAIIAAVPEPLRLAIGAGIGLFIAYIGLKQGGILKFANTHDEWTAGAEAIPGLVSFTDTTALVTLIGLAVTAALVVLKVRGALFISIIASTVAALSLGVTSLPDTLFSVSAIGDIDKVAFKLFGNPGLGSLFGDTSRLFSIIVTLTALVLTSMFDTIGTFLGTGARTGIFTDENLKEMRESKPFSTPIERGLFADVTATTAGSMLGTSNVTTYVESAAGIGEGGKTGLSSLITAAAFLLCLPFASLIDIVPAQATAPILVIVGVLMVGNVSKIKWDDFSDALPAFLTIIIMPMSYSITNGVAFGFMAYCLTKAAKGDAKKVHPLIYIFAALFLLNLVMSGR
ncbi:MAG: NCS2 family permease [Oscillospiraceae bacterium]|nr:NCS2 family permease [Oscillospiraceae bacterium]